MDQAMLLQFVGSAVAVLILATLLAKAGLAKPTPPLDETLARKLLSEDHPDEPIDRLWIDEAGQTAVARSGDQGIVLFRVGDGFATRSAPWSELAVAQVRDDSVIFRFDDPGAPAAAFRLGGPVPFA